jgi:hypothetical protein
MKHNKIEMKARKKSGHLLSYVKFCSLTPKIYQNDATTSTNSRKEGLKSLWL